MIRTLAAHFGIPLSDAETDTKVYRFPTDGSAKGIVDQALASRGFRVRTFGNADCDAIAPDFKAEGYHTGVLWIYDPCGGNGALSWDSGYTYVWRATHEYGHAVTLAEVNTLWGGDGRRAGKLGAPLSGREARRALAWEGLAFGAQWAFLRNLTMHRANNWPYPLQLNYWREYAINALDSLVRVITGEFSDPAKSGVDIKAWESPLSPPQTQAACERILLGAILARE